MSEELIKEELKAAEGEPERLSKQAVGQKLLWIPFADIEEHLMNTAGHYAKEYPVGAIVHFTSGRPGKGAISYGRKMGYCYLHIDEKGEITQSAPLNKWGYHAGASAWPGLGTGVSSKLVGIEIACAGKVKQIEPGKYESWFGVRYEDGAVRKVAKRDNMEAGYYHKYTQAQEQSLIKLLLWLKSNNPTVFTFDYVLGHDEVSPGRKNDPGGSLSMTMPELRKHLKFLEEKNSAQLKV